MFQLTETRKLSFVDLLVRPDIAFGLTWLIVFALYALRLVNYFPALNLRTVALVWGSLGIGVGASFLWTRLDLGRRWVRPLHGEQPPIVSLASVGVLLAAWLVGFFVIVAYSRGVPLQWYLTGVPKTYIDYGMPTFSGAWNTFRVVIAILSVFLAVGRPKLHGGAIAICVFLTFTVILEANRGGLVLFALNLLAAAVIAAPTTKRKMLSAALILVVTAACIVLIGNIRSSDPKAAAAVEGALSSSAVVVERPKNTPLVGAGANRAPIAASASPGTVAAHSSPAPVTASSSPQAVVASSSPSRAAASSSPQAVVASSSPPAVRPISWIYLYLTTPLANLDNAATLKLARAPFPGFYTFYPLIPSVVRPTLPDETRYALPLLSGGYTMTTAFGTAVADFGFAGASVLLGLQLAVGSLVFVLARRHLWAAIAAPMFFATAVLSFFANYFFTLLMPFHVALAVALAVLLAKLPAANVPASLASSEPTVTD